MELNRGARCVRKRYEEREGKRQKEREILCFRDFRGSRQRIN